MNKTSVKYPRATTKEFEGLEDIIADLKALEVKIKKIKELYLSRDKEDTI